MTTARAVLDMFLLRQPVIVFQMAKVGSTSIVDALARGGVRARHVHRMRRKHLIAMRGARAARGWAVPPVPAHDRLGLRLRNSVVRMARSARIVTLVREPIARNLSSYFEHLDAIWQRQNAHETVPADSLCRGFLERYTHSEPLTWFDDEMRPVFGIDVYQYPFPKEGHLTIRQGRFEMLILKSELDDETKSRALAAFFDGADVSVRRVNVTETKAAGEACRRFAQTIQLPPEYVDEMMNAPYTRHF